MGKNAVMDLHCHSIHSTDGYYSVQGLIDRAKARNLDYFSVTDHDNVSYILDYLQKKGLKPNKPYHKIDNIKYVPGVEVTCRINDKSAQNRKLNPAKVHILVYSPVVDQKNLFFKMLKAKRENDISYDYGALMKIAEFKDVQLDEANVRKFVREKAGEGFSTFGRDLTYDYFHRNYKKLFSSRKEFDNLYDDITQTPRLNLDVRDVINFAHDVGGLCVMAHPKPTLERIINPDKAVDCLMDYGIDGFEMVCPSMNKKTSQLIETVIKRHQNKNPIIYTGGSDFHKCEDWRDLGCYKEDREDDIFEYIRTKDATNFEKEMKKLSEAREDLNVATHRRYEQVSSEKLIRKLDKIEKNVQETRLLKDGFQIYNKTKDYSIPEFEKELLEEKENF